MRAAVSVWVSSTRPPSSSFHGSFAGFARRGPRPMSNSIPCRLMSRPERSSTVTSTWVSPGRCRFGRRSTRRCSAMTDSCSPCRLTTPLPVNGRCRCGGSCGDVRGVLANEFTLVARRTPFAARRPRRRVRPGDRSNRVHHDRRSGGSRGGRLCLPACADFSSPTWPM